MKCLFIGGPKAGQMVEVNPNILSIQVPILPMTSAKFDPYQQGPDPITFSFVIYRRDFATDQSGNRHTLYVAEGSGDPLTTLLNFYAAADHPKPFV